MIDSSRFPAGWAGAERTPSLVQAMSEWRMLAGLLAYYWQLDALVRDCPAGDGHSVLVLPGFMGGDGSTRPLRLFLRTLGYRAHGWGQGPNLGASERKTEQMAARLHALSHRSGSKVSLIGWSLGGIYAREMARTYPGQVRRVITLGSPFRGNPNASRAIRLYRLLNPRHHEQITPEAVAAREQPLPVPMTAIYSRRDGIVDWRCCRLLENDLGPLAENIEVRCAHLGYGHDPLTLRIVAERLASPPSPGT